MNRLHRLSIITLVAAGVALSGCAQQSELAPAETPSATPTPTQTVAPDPAKPKLGELTLTTEGLGDLSFGSMPPSANPSLDLVAFDPDACKAEGLPGLWKATYPDIDEGYGPTAPFAIQVVDDAITRIDVNTTQIFTDSGIHIGSSLDEVLGVYSGGPDQVVNHADVSDVYVIKGTRGQLQFEIAVDRIEDYWDPSVIDTVVFLSAIDIATEPYGVAATENGIAGCNAP